MDFGEELVDASKVIAGATRQPLFFRCVDGKAQILLRGCKSWKAESPPAIVFWVCGLNRADCLANFATKQTMETMWDANLPIGAVYRQISPARRIPNCGLQGVMHVFICAIYSERDSIIVAAGKSHAVVARALLQQGAGCISRWNTHSTPHHGSSSGQPARHTGRRAARPHRTMKPHLNVMFTDVSRSRKRCLPASR